MIAKIIAAARSTPVRIVVAACGVAGVVLILRGLGWDKVTDALAGAALYLPIILALDGLGLACSMMALRALYGDAARELPPSALVRAGLVGFAVNGLLPAGRAVAEATRASLLAKYVGKGTAAAAAARMQGVVMVAHGVMSIVATIAAVIAVGWTWLPLAIGINAVVVLVMGAVVLFATSRSRIGAWIGRRFSRAQQFGSELDAAFAREPGIPMRAIGWELAGRAVEVAQKAVLIAAIGGVVGIIPALTVEGIHLLGAAIGDLVPAQLGVQEGNFTLASSLIGLPASGAVSIALLAHLSQLAWVLVGSLLPLVWRVRSEVKVTT